MWPWRRKKGKPMPPRRKPPEPEPLPDHGAVYCGICKRGKWRFNDVLLCAICDNPESPTKGTTTP